MTTGPAADLQIRALTVDNGDPDRISAYRVPPSLLWGHRMRIKPEAFRHCVFLCDEREDERAELQGIVIKKPIATGFLVGAEITNDIHATYVVTARHVIEGVRGRPLFVRVNTTDGKSRYVTTDPLEWVKSDDADLALLAFHLEPDFDVSYKHWQGCVGADYTYKVFADQVGVEHLVSVMVGDDAAIVGLFLDDYGEASNLPVARFGHISRMPSLVNTPRWEGDDFKSVAYLIECLSWAGLSGSPVFVVFKFARQFHQGSSVTITEEQYVTPLLGIVNGHIDRPRKVKITGDILLGELRYELNTGIAIVTPAMAIRPLLNHPDLVRKREELAAAARAKGQLVTLDSGVLDAKYKPPASAGLNLIFDEGAGGG